MRKLIKIYKNYGMYFIIEIFFQRLVSYQTKVRYKYSSGFLIGKDTAWLAGQYAHIGENFRMGKRGRIETIDEHNGFYYQPQLTIGNNVSFNDDVHIGCVNKITIGNNVLLASKIYISDHNHGKYKGSTQSNANEPPGQRLLSMDTVEIGDNVWIGEMVSILPGVKIGCGSIIGSNSVVSRDIPENVIAVGSPAVPVKKFNFLTGLWERMDN